MARGGARKRTDFVAGRVLQQEGCNGGIATGGRFVTDEVYNNEWLIFNNGVGNVGSFSNEELFSKGFVIQQRSSHLRGQSSLLLCNVCNVSRSLII